MRLAPLLLAVVLAGCLSPVQQTPQSSTHDRLEPLDAELAAQHPEATREDGAVEVEFVTTPFPGYQARRTVVIHNTVAPFASASASYGVPVGRLTVATHRGEAYETTITLHATAPTEQEAREALATMVVHHHDEVEDGFLSFGARVEFKQRDDMLATVQRHAVADVGLPDISYALEAATATAELQVTGVRGPSLHAETSTGGLDLESIQVGELTAATSTGALALDRVTADRLRASTSTGSLTAAATVAREASFSTSTGSIDATVAGEDVELDSSTGSIEAVVTPTSSGSVTADASTGLIELRLARGEAYGYDARASSNTGEASIELDGARDRSEGRGDEAHATTPGFPGKDIQVTVEASSSTGDVVVRH